MPDDIHQPKTSLPPELEDGDEAVVTFHPQIWQNEYAITGDDTETYMIPIEDALNDDGTLLEDDTYGTDKLTDHENAPEKAQNWDGPFYITIDEVR